MVSSVPSDKAHQGWSGRCNWLKVVSSSAFATTSQVFCRTRRLHPSCNGPSRTRSPTLASVDCSLNQGKPSHAESRRRAPSSNSCAAPIPAAGSPTPPCRSGSHRRSTWWARPTMYPRTNCLGREFGPGSPWRAGPYRRPPSAWRWSWRMPSAMDTDGGDGDDQRGDLFPRRIRSLAISPIHLERNRRI